jgi:hypothetical protein
VRQPVDSPGGIPAGVDHTGGATAPTVRGATVTLTPGLVLGFVSVIAIVLGLFISESDGTLTANLWDRTSAELWSIVAIVAAVATLVPSLRAVLNVPARPAWIIAAVAGGYLVFWWVLFVLPRIGFNVAFLATLGVAAGVAAVWTSPDNPYRDTYTGS